MEPETLGQLLRRRRTEMGLTQKQMAPRIGLAQSEVSRLERDTMSVPDDAWDQLLAGLGITESEIGPYLAASARLRVLRQLR